MTMTPRERVLAVLHGERPDKVPFTMSEVFVPRCTVERQLRTEGMCLVTQSAKSYRLETPNCVTEEHHYMDKGKPHVRTVIKTPVGEVSCVNEVAAFTLWLKESLFKTPEDYAPLKFLAKDEVVVPTYDEVLKARAWMGDDFIIRADVGRNPLHHIMVRIMEPTTFAIEWTERRDEIDEWIDLLTVKLLERTRVFADSPITHTCQGGNETPDVMGPPRFREYVMPCYEKCAAICHAKGNPYGTHLDGNNRAWAEDIAASPLDFIEAFSPSPDTDMTMAEGLEAWPDKVLWINFPSSVHLQGVEKVKEMAREIVALGRETNRVIIGVTEDFPLDTWQENFLAISEVINEG